MWDENLVDMQLTSKLNNEFRFLLCVNDIYSKYALIIPLKDVLNVMYYILKNVLHINVKNVLQLLRLYRKLPVNLIASQIKYGLIKAVNFKIDQWNNG